jgi:hypothetical protein
MNSNFHKHKQGQNLHMKGHHFKFVYKYLHFTPPIDRLLNVWMPSRFMFLLSPSCKDPAEPLTIDEIADRCHCPEDVSFTDFHQHKPVAL